MLQRIKDHLSKSYNFVFWLVFAPAMVFTLWGVSDLYMNHFDELTRQDHMQFFLRILFPVSLGLLITALERRQRLKRDALVGKIKKYLNKN
jgi:hypothetical protein